MQVAAARIVLDEYHAEDSIEKPTLERLDLKEKDLFIKFKKEKETELSRNKKKITEKRCYMQILFKKSC